MGKRLTIPSEVLALNPDFNIHEIRAMIGVIWKNKNNRLRQAHIFKVKLPAIGTLKSRGNKRPKRRQSVLKKAATTLASLSGCSSCFIYLVFISIL